MDILVHHQRETTTNREKGQEASKKAKKKVERRKSLRDRRRSVVEGIVVSLSTVNEERRSRFERRSSAFHPCLAGQVPPRTGKRLLNVVA